MFGMKRRTFIRLLGGGAAWPLAARAQQGENVRRICVLTAGVGGDDPDAQARNAEFVLTLQQLGWTSGRNLRTATKRPRWAKKLSRPQGGRCTLAGTADSGANLAP
jgi:hypothetical protein